MNRTRARYSARETNPRRRRGRLKLEWGTLRARPGHRVDDLLWWDGDQLLGFLGLYSFDGRTVELAGMVDRGGPPGAPPL